MASIVIRGLNEAVKKQLVMQAKEHGGSMEAEVRDILTKAARRPHIGLALMQPAQEAGGVDDLLIPERIDVARVVDFERSFSTRTSFGVFSSLSMTPGSSRGWNPSVVKSPSLPSPSPSCWPACADSRWGSAGRC